MEEHREFAACFVQFAILCTNTTYLYHPLQKKNWPPFTHISFFHSVLTHSLSPLLTLIHSHSLAHSHFPHSSRLTYLFLCHHSPISRFFTVFSLSHLYSYSPISRLQLQQRLHNESRAEIFYSVLTHSRSHLLFSLSLFLSFFLSLSIYPYLFLCHHSPISRLQLQQRLQNESRAVA
jgi:hypothetical protein